MCETGRCYYTFYVWYDLQNIGISGTTTVNPRNKQSLKRGEGSWVGRQLVSQHGIFHWRLVIRKRDAGKPEGWPTEVSEFGESYLNKMCVASELSNTQRSFHRVKIGRSDGRQPYGMPSPEEHSFQRIAPMKFSCSLGFMFFLVNILEGVTQNKQTNPQTISSDSMESPHGLCPFYRQAW